MPITASGVRIETDLAELQERNTLTLHHGRLGKARDPEALTVFTRLESGSNLAQQVENRIKQSTYGRIRDLKVEEVQGSMVIRGRVPSHHMRQLALHGALELLSGDRLAALITVD